MNYLIIKNQTHKSYKDPAVACVIDDQKKNAEIDNGEHVFVVHWCSCRELKLC